jgi:hypothetical protein
MVDIKAVTGDWLHDQGLDAFWPMWGRKLGRHSYGESKKVMASDEIDAMDASLLRDGKKVGAQRLKSC